MHWSYRAIFIYFCFMLVNYFSTRNIDLSKVIGQIVFIFNIEFLIGLNVDAYCRLFSNFLIDFLNN